MAGKPGAFTSHFSSGFFSSAFGGATLAPYLARLLQSWGVADGLSDSLALVLMTLLIAYLSLVLGELVPKSLALRFSDSYAFVVARQPPSVDRKSVV